MKKQGFTLVEIMIVVAIIALLTAIAIPAFLQYRKDARRSLCINNLRLIDHAKEALAIKFNWTAGADVAGDPAALPAARWAVLMGYIDGGTAANVLQCPENKSDVAGGANHYTYNPVDTTPVCPKATDLSFTEHVYSPD